MRIRVSVRVRFRVAGLTLGTFRAAWELRAGDGATLAARPIDPEREPEDARALCDERGVRVAVW